MACRPAARGEARFSAVRFKAINSRTGEGQLDRCPFLIRSGNGRQDARPCFAHALSLFCAGFAWAADHAVFGSAFSALGTVAILGAAQPRGTGADMDQLVLKRASASRLSGEWSEDDYDVL